MPLSLHRYLADLNIDLNVSFSYQNVHVQTVSKKDLRTVWNRGRNDKDQKSAKYLLVEAYTEIEEFDSLSEGAANVRPILLATLGLLTFITGEVFTIYDFNQLQNYVIKEIPDYQLKTEYSLGDSVKVLALEKLLAFLNNSSKDKKELIYSLFDRYRKATSIASEHEEGTHLNDEVFLAYFHILELLAGQYASELKANIKQANKHFLTNLYADILLFDSDKALEEAAGKQKALDQLVIQHVPVTAQICYMYKRLGLFNGKSRQVIESYVKLRNDLAHGRSVYIQKLTFPLPPFFSQVKDIANEIEIISLVAIRTIDAYLKTDFYEAEWDYFIKHQPNPLFEVKKFIQNKTYEKISVPEFHRGKADGIKPWMLSYYYFKKKLKRPQLELALKPVIMDLPLNKKNIHNHLNTLILLSDSSDEQLRLKCQEMITEAYKQKYPPSRARDYLKHFEYNNFNLIWFKVFVGNYIQQH